MKLLNFSLARLIARIRSGPSKTTISAIRAATALTIAFILIFLDVFDRLIDENLAMTSMILVIIVLGPGRRIGDFNRNLIIGAAGLLSLGVPGFVVLAEMGESPVGAGFLFALVVFLAALVRAKGRLYNPFYLFSILFAYQGIFTSALVAGKFSRDWLLGTCEAWCWGYAISIFTCLVVWPQSSENELVQLIGTSLNNVQILSALICKTYESDISEAEKAARDFLIKSIRKDYTSLTERADECAFEIRISRYSLSDFRDIIARVQSLQQALITVSTALHLMELEETTLKGSLPRRAEAIENFKSFRNGINIVISEIKCSMLNKSITLSTPNVESLGKDFKDVEDNGEAPVSANATTVLSLGATLEKEVANDVSDELETKENLSSVDLLEVSWERFSRAERQIAVAKIRSEAEGLGDFLQIDAGGASLNSLYADSLLSPPDWKQSELDTNSQSLQSLTKSFSVIHGFESFTEELKALHSFVRSPRSKKLRLRIIERYWKSSNHVQAVMSVQEALHKLHGDENYKTPEISLIHRFLAFEKLGRSDASIYASKVTIGAVVYLTLLLSPDLQDFFLKYGMSSSLITILVAITPLLGSTLLAFFLQLLGFGVGNVYGLIILQISMNDEGYSPYILAVALSLMAFVSSYIFYMNPKYYSLGTLLMGGAGGLVANEWLHLGDVPAFDVPSIRSAYSLTAMSVSIAIAGTLQILLPGFRHSARKQLRLEISAVTFGLSAYNTLLQSYANAVAPGDLAGRQPSRAALDSLHTELILRESALQRSIIALGPTFEFARIEPKVYPFKGDVITRVINSHQIILDRMRESRAALGKEGFDKVVQEQFISKLYPYRIQTQRQARTLFYLSATSLISKTPLPRDLDSSKTLFSAFSTDTLVLSRRMSLTLNGEQQLQSGFLRYWFYLTANQAVGSQLEILALHLGALLGVPEEMNKNLK